MWSIVSEYQVSNFPGLADLMSPRIYNIPVNSKSIWKPKPSRLAHTMSGGYEDGSGYIAYSEDGTLMCTKCGNMFTTKQGLVEHIKRHKGINRYYCDICHKGFRMKGHFEGHMNAHMNVKPYMCQKCGKAFSYRHSYLRHLSSCDRV